MTTEILLNKLYQIKSKYPQINSSTSFEMDIEKDLGNAKEAFAHSMRNQRQPGFNPPGPISPQGPNNPGAPMARFMEENERLKGEMRELREMVERMAGEMKRIAGERKRDRD